MLNPLTKCPLQKLKNMFRVFSIFLLHSIFDIEKKCVLTILNAINRKIINCECLVPQDLRECRVSRGTDYQDE